jgi:C1A family cysteine protease
MPSSVDLREYFPEVQEQRHLNSSAVHAAISLLEYFERRANGVVIEPSRMFLYYITRKLLRTAGNCGTDLRSTLKAMIRFGVPPEIHWPYEVDKCDVPPDAFLYSLALQLTGTEYVRLDVSNSTGERTLQVVRAFLAAGFPVAFGFPVPNSISSDADIPYRPATDAILGGQAALAVGYDDRHVCDSRGALLFRNSWGKQWGEAGCGWLPYSFVEHQLAVDFWTLINPNWLASGEFTQPLVM